MDNVEFDIQDIPAPDYSDCEEESEELKYDIPEPDYLSDSDIDGENNDIITSVVDEKVETVDNTRLSESEEVDAAAVSVAATDVTAADGTSAGTSAGTAAVQAIISPSGEERTLILTSDNQHVALDPVLIQPKKLRTVCVPPAQIRNINHELLFKQKKGALLEQKPELLKKMDQRKMKLKEEEIKQSQENRRSSLDIKLEERAKILQAIEEQTRKNEENQDTVEALPEFLQVHSKIRSKSASHS